MKKLSIVLLAGTLIFQSCGNGNNNTDSVDSANQANKEATNANDTSATPVMTTDKESADFAVKAANAGMMEVDLGNWAKDHAVRKDVKDFGAMMVADHTQANDELKAIAASKNITLPAEVSDDAKKHIEDMQNMKGSDFDKHYVNMMVDDHKDAIDLFEKAAKNSTDADLKAFAEKTLPTLRKHQDAIKAIKAKM